MTRPKHELEGRGQHAAFLEAERLRREALVWDVIKDAIVKGLGLGGVQEIAGKTKLTAYQVQRVVQAFEQRGQLQTETKGPKRRYGVNGLWSEWSTPSHVRLMAFGAEKRAKKTGPCISGIAEACTGRAPDYPFIRMCARCAALGRGMAFVEAGSSGGRAGLNRSSAAKGL